MLTACGSSTNDNSETSEKKEAKEKDTEAIKVTVDDDIIVNLDEKRELKKLSFMYDSKVRYMSGDSYYMMDYYVNNSIELRISVEFKKDSTPSDEMTSKNASQKGTKKINDIEWIYYEGKNMTNQNTYYYLYQVDNDTYVVAFITSKNVDILINTFMNNVLFE